MLATYAEHLASGRPRAGPVGYDPTVERERLAFEREKWEAEQQEKLRIAEFEKQKWEAEQRKEEAEQEERRRKEEAEQEDKRRREFLEKEQIDLKRQELQYQIDRNRADDERRNSAAAKGKMFGDAMRNSAIRMGVDPIDAIPFFRNVEQLFEVYEVPAQLQAMLI